MNKMNRLGLICVIVLLIAVIAVTTSFSWLTRPSGVTNVKNLQLSGVSAVIKSQDCTVDTYSCDIEIGDLVNDQTVLTGSSFTIPAGERQYFKSVVTNSGNSKTSISLTNLKLSGMDGSVTINNLNPLKTTSGYSENMNIAEHLSVDAKGTLNIEWYIYNGSKSEKSISFTSLPAISYDY